LRASISESPPAAAAVVVAVVAVDAVDAVEDFVAIDPPVMEKLADMKPNYSALVPDIVPLLVAAAAAAAAASLSGFGAVPMGQHAVRHFERTFH
jgi:hypothetical protein